MTMSALRWVAVTLVAAIIGAYGSWIVNRARPSVALADISISRAFNDRFGSDRPIAVDSKNPAITSLLESFWVEAIREPSLPLNKLVETLEKNRSRVDTALQAIQRLQQDFPQLQRILSREKSENAVAAAEFFDIWERNDGIIYGSIRGHFRRGVYQLPNPLPTYQDPGVLLLSIVARTGGGPIYGVSKRGGVFVSTLVPEDDQDLPLNKFAAQALAHFDTASLMGMLDLVEGVLAGRSLHENMRDSLDEYLVGLSRWSISVVASNAGGTPLSIAPKAQLILNSKNTALNQPHLVLPLEHRDKDGNLIPASVPGGESRSIRFVSRDLISDMTEWKTLHEMYENSSLDSVLLIEITPAPAFGEKQVLSMVRRFGQIEPFAGVDYGRIEAKF